MKEELEKYIKKLRVWACQSCHVCGGEMTFAASSRDGSKYTCKKAADGVLKYKWGTKEERENAEHYRDSESWDRRTSSMSIFIGVADDLEKILQSSCQTTSKELQNNDI